MPILRRLRSKTKQSKVERQLRRRTALFGLNKLSEELQLGVALLLGKETSAAVVTRRVKLLEPRCQQDDLPRRLRKAVEAWKNNGGKLTCELLPPLQCSSPSQAPEQTTTLEPTTGRADSALPLHKVLDSGFRLRSRGFMMTFNSKDFTRDTWPAFCSHVKQLCELLKARGWAANWEQSLEASSVGESTRFHGHGYLFWTDEIGAHMRNTDELVFRNVRPRIDVCTAKNPNAFRLSAARGMWYVSILKKGTCEVDTNYPPWRQYTPKAAWLDDLWGSHKLTHIQYLTLSKQFGKGHSSRRRDAMEALRDERGCAVQELIEAELNLLRKAGMVKKMKQHALVDEFVALFKGAPRFRRPMLVVVGGTNLGKSMLAAHVLRQVAHTLALPSVRDEAASTSTPFLEVTVEDSTQLDLGDFDLSTHAGVLLDGVGDTLFLKRNREVLQGRPKVCKGGKSGTMMYAYPYTLCRRAVVATFDLSASNLELLQTDHWLSDSRNVMQLHLDGPAWESEAAETPAPQDLPLPREQMASWGVDQLAEFFTSKDLRGPAEALRVSGVAGADLLAWSTASELQADLKLTPFTARKVLATRNAFLKV